MKTLKYIIFLLLIAGIGFSIYIAVQPNSFEVSRSRVIKAPNAVVYNNVIDFKNWEAWSVWVEKDPETIITLPEKTKGIGGSYSWVDSNGSGTMKTLSITPNTSIEQELQFDDFEPSNIQWNFETTENNATKVTWKMNSDKVPFIFKASALFSGGFEQMIGPDFERGLEKLDSIVVESTKQYSITQNGVTEYGGGFYLYKTTSANNSNISSTMGQQFGQIIAYTIKNNITPNGMPFTIYENMDLEDGNVIMSQAIPVASKITITDDSNIISGFIPKIKVLKATLKGNYTYLSEAWAQVMKYIADNNIEQTDVKPFEIYITDPDNYPNPADWITEIYIPIK
ncbi:SRPBCC family protein [Winogradskyella immobilis]|uniref:GyrI-like domain-containing protein n=1 Tax=Winogradskyella immobilis TaxID=2816852 RepID=A0ABS8EMP3_9FLAO|nr:GyrI-like domain-containing protein [Winogradskyella immobilis]MCC1484494.1 GyrI-like domain-containing protein [Winogradskyella immobilis]MCG0016586.1 GyrI-like domain-containing protein [Winogradskyella immobilis]